MKGLIHSSHPSLFRYWTKMRVVIMNEDRFHKIPLSSLFLLYSHPYGTLQKYRSKHWIGVSSFSLHFKRIWLHQGSPHFRCWICKSVKNFWSIAACNRQSIVTSHFMLFCSRKWFHGNFSKKQYFWYSSKDFSTLWVRRHSVAFQEKLESSVTHSLRRFLGDESDFLGGQSAFPLIEIRLRTFSANLLFPIRVIKYLQGDISVDT